MTTQWTYTYKQTGGTHHGPLKLRWEIEYSPCVDECDSDDGQDQLEFWIRRLQDRHPEWIEADAVPIYWQVAGPHGSEHAPFNAARHGFDEDFLTHFTWPEDADGNLVDWFALPLDDPRFPAFARALAWTPSPLQRDCPLRSLMASRRMTI